MDDKLLDKYPLHRMKKLHMDIITVSEELFNLDSLLDYGSDQTSDYLKNLIQPTLGRLCAIAEFLSKYTLGGKK